MVQETKPGVANQKADVKTIPLADFLAFKKGAVDRERKLKAQLAEMDASVKSLGEELEVAQTNVEDDDDMKAVRQLLLKQKRELDQRESQIGKDLAGLEEREKSARAKELAVEYSIDVDTLLGEDDIEGTALRLHNERLAEENKALKEASAKPPAGTPKIPESKTIYEGGPVAVVRKNVNDMTHEEFVKYENDLKAKAGYR